MARLHQVVGGGSFGHGHLNGASAISRRDTRGHTLRGFNRDGESGAVHRAIALHHGWQL